MASFGKSQSDRFQKPSGGTSDSVGPGGYNVNHSPDCFKKHKKGLLSAKAGVPPALSVRPPPR